MGTYQMSKRKYSKVGDRGVVPVKTESDATGTGRPRIKWELSVVEALGYVKASHETLAYILGVSTTTIEREFKKQKSTFVGAYKKGLAQQRKNLVSLLIAKAEGGDTTALIFALKNFCGFADKVENTGEQSLRVVVEGQAQAPRFLQDLTRDRRDLNVSQGEQ
jgi:hypothetical protein